MSLIHEISQKQSQSLVLTPQLQQAIKILELSNLELASYLESEILANPLLSYEDGDHPLEEILPLEEQEDEEQAAFDELWQSSAKSPSDNPGSSLDTVEGPSISLREHLEHQLATDIEDVIEKLVGSYLISLVEDTGYLPPNYRDQAQVLNINDDTLDSTLKKLQQFDPPGIFARSLKECLRLQLKDRGQLDDEVNLVLENLDLIELGEIQKLEKICKITTPQLKNILTLIRQCDPKPGLKFSQEDVAPVIPDIIVTQSPQGEWVLRLNQKTMPKIKVDENYYEALRGGACKKGYITERFSAANGLMKALQQRARSILSISEQILSRQKAFFEKGIHYLKPMTLHDVAEETGLHESTVSRVTTNKYMQTPRGTYELKFFFTSSIYNLHEEGDLSSRAVREKIKELVKMEEKHKPFSDDQLVKLLNTEGILVARRTVAKYREALKIPSSYQRKRSYTRQMELTE